MSATHVVRSSIFRDPRRDITHPWIGCASFLIVILWSLTLSGCSSIYETTKSARSPNEQLLLTQSLEHGLTDAVLPIPPGQSVAVETVGLTADQAFVTALIEKWLSREGLNLPKDGKESLIARVTLEAFGTLQDQTFFGIPQISGGLLPIAVPELAFYKAQRQRGLARFSIDFIDKKTGRLIRSTPRYEGDAFYNQFTVLFGLNYRKTDLLPPPP
ncbi:MAG: hypothetical protein ACREJN_17055 [Nitrospiraceae bacterium]